MKVFISHSWKDKTTADRLYNDLKSMADVWQDIRELSPGDNIQDVIDKALAEMDLVVVLWSSRTAGSDGVAAEVDTALRGGRKIVVCLLEKAPKLPDTLKSLLSIDLGPEEDDYKLGFGRLCAVMATHAGSELGIDMSDADVESMNDAGAVLNRLQEIMGDSDTSETDKAYLLSRMMSSVDEVMNRVGSLKDNVAQDMAFMKEVQQKLAEAGSDRAKLQDLLQELIRKEHRNPDLVQQVRSMIEYELASLPEETPAPPPAPALAPRVSQAQESLGTAAEGIGGELEQWLRGKVPDRTLGATVALLEYYITTMRVSLETLGAIATSAQSPAAMQVVGYLVTYLEDPNDLLPESVHGAWGYLDDAWLIHNVAYRLVEAGIIPVSMFSVDWSRIAAADRVAVACLPQMVRYQLENYLNQLLALISAEMSSYVPQFVHGGGTYHPYMGDARAVDADSAFAETATDYMDAAMAGMSLDSWS
ncbi:toll/interleukin-1 receptor domain-containing protein [bacterium]|nr:toll/interleukin-1 receptor domain-containing protein [bacterium]